MTTFGEIIGRYEAGEIEREDALAALLEFGLTPDEAEEALGIAEGESDLVGVED